MMTGMITAHREAALSVIVRGLHGQEEHVEAVIDTGFNGFMVLPNPLVATLGLPYHTHTMATLADGTTVTLAIYKATIVWHGHDSSVYVLAAEGGPLIGMALLHGNRVTLDVVDGGPVTVEELPWSTQYAATLLDARAGDADYKSTYNLSLYLEQVVQHFSRYRKYASAVLGQNSVWIS